LSKEIQQIISKLKTFSSEEKNILATVIDLKGSGYRLPGAKMLIAENGDAFGTVSGGCLESDVLERAQNVLKTGEAEILTYDTTGKSDSVFSLNMGCNGVVSILIEPIEKENLLFESWQTAIEERARHTIGTLVSNDSETQIGGRIFYSQDEKLRFENLPEFLKDLQEIKDFCVAFFENNESAKTVEFTIEKGKFEFFFENINPPLNLIIFGAGYDAIPLADFAKNMGWRVSIVDHRAAFATEERFPNADEITISHPENLHEKLMFDKDSVAVVMTHNYEKDREIMKFLLKQDLQYIGALGPKRRTEKLLEGLKAEGFNFSDFELEKLHAPIGLDIGADTPEAIALSIVAEIKSILSNRNGGFLRERQGSIYGRNSI
jgi:xanthine/CO dehydrogenase XdhC/CoxF family maturation factor